MTLSLPASINEAINKVIDKLTRWVESFIVMLPNLIVAVIIFLIFYYIAKLIKKIATKPLYKISSSKALIDLALNVIFFVISMIGLLIALEILKLDKALTSLLAGAGILGLAIGFAFQDIMANFVAGVLLALRKPIGVGDIIETNDYFGTVININLRSTIIRTLQGQLVYIPNKKIYGDPIINYSDESKRRIDLNCGISYGEDLEKVKKITEEAIGTLDYLLPEREISFIYTEFGDSSINFTIRYWVKFKRQLDYSNALSDGIMAIKKAFDANGISIPFPIRTLDFGIKGGEKLSEHLNISHNGNGKVKINNPD